MTPCTPGGGMNTEKASAVALYSDKAGGTALPGRICPAAGAEI